MREQQEHTFGTHDGVELFYRHWPATGATRRGAVVLFHRGHEHGARMAHLVDELDLPDFDFFAWDARGHGRSPGARGHSPSFAHSVRDVQTFVEHIGHRKDDREIVTAIIQMGHTLGFRVVAEGVETGEQLAYLKEKGCDVYQGYLKSHPLPAERFETFAFREQR